MKELTKQEFWNWIIHRDIVLRANGEYPYTTEFKTRNGDLVGKSLADRYFLDINLIKTVKEHK